MNLYTAGGQHNTAFKKTIGPIEFNLQPKGFFTLPSTLKDISALEQHITQLLPSINEGFNWFVVAGYDSLPGESFYNGNGRTFISILREGQSIEDCLARLYAIQFQTVYESLKLQKAMFRKMKLRFILLDGQAEWPVEAAFTRFFGPAIEKLADMLDFDVQFRRQAISKLPEDFTLKPEFFSGPKAISSFADNDESGPEPILRMVLLPGADKTEAISIGDWGAVVYASQIDDLKAPMQYFMSAFRSHLGLSPLPLGAFSSLYGLTAVEKDLLKAKSAQILMKESLSLLTLIQRSENELMTAELVSKHFKPMLEAIKDYMQSHSFSSAQSSFSHAYRLHYHPDRLGPPYFPDEHKFAVYLPVYLPLLLPLLVGILKCLKELRKSKKEKKKTE